MSWDIRSNYGNLSTHVPVNDCVNTVHKLEYRKQGRPYCAKRDMKHEEYHNTMQMLDMRDNFEIHSKCPSMLKFQFHIIARTGVITNLKTENLRSHAKFGMFVLQTKVSWIKNVMEERACLDHILIGAADTYFCMLLSLACYIESRFALSNKCR
jgi:hypothetical protein